VSVGMDINECDYCNNSPASTCSPNHVEVVARLWRVLWVDSLHELLEDHQRGQTTDSTAIEREEAEISVWHRWSEGGSVNIELLSPEMQSRHAQWTWWIVELRGGGWIEAGAYRLS
jgi:hypothetical protein